MSTKEQPMSGTSCLKNGIEKLEDIMAILQYKFHTTLCFFNEKTINTMFVITKILGISF